MVALPSMRLPPKPPPTPRPAVQMICHLVAYVTFGVGLISPLTPSKGLPSLGDGLFFGGLPVVLLIVSRAAATDHNAKVVVTFEILALSGVLIALLGRQAHLF